MPPATRDCRLRNRRPHRARRREVDAAVGRASVASAVAVLTGQRRSRRSRSASCTPTPTRSTKSAPRDLVKKLWPEVYLCTSNDVLAEFREFERFATATVNASLMPVMDRYLERFERGVRRSRHRSAPRVMQSNGGAVRRARCAGLPVNTFFSGPAGGVIGGVGSATQLGLRQPDHLRHGRHQHRRVPDPRRRAGKEKRARRWAAFRCARARIDIHTIGAGGGSIAWIDAGGLLKVGPQSAGADPGPGRYGRGGTEPTVTDANVVLGRLNPKTLLGGRMAMHARRGAQRVDGRARAKLGVDRTRPRPAFSRSSTST